MAEEREKLIQAARQLIETESLFGGESIPARRNPLPPSESAPPQMSLDQKAAALDEMDLNEIRGCVKCPLCENRTQTVLGEGDPDADLVFIGEGPGEEEDRTGRPFVGRAGELLTKMLHAMGLRREEVYICNLLKCRPPGNRSPAPEEIKACWDYLIRQLQIIRPRVIITMGNPATQNLLNIKIGITRIRGNWQKLPPIGEHLEGIDVMPTFHPAYLLRQYTPENRGKVWSDLQQVMAAVGLEPPGKSKE